MQGLATLKGKNSLHRNRNRKEQGGCPQRQRESSVEFKGKLDQSSKGDGPEM